MSPETRLIWQVAPESGLGLLVMGLCALALAVSIWSTAGRPGRIRLGLALLRGAALVGMALLVLGPRWERARVARAPGVVAVLVDRSASMTLPDGREPRSAHAANWLRQASPVLSRWAGRSDVVYYRVGAQTEGPMSRRAATQGLVSPRLAAGTDLLGALEHLTRHHQPGLLRGVLLLSDGQDTRWTAPQLTAAHRARLRELGAPISVVPMGGRALLDAAVAWVHSDDLAFVRSPARFRVGLRVLGTNAPVQVRLWWDGRLADTKVVTGQEQREVILEHTPLRKGRVPVSVEVIPLAGEATRINNTHHLIQRVVRDRIRVLQIAGRPSWDVRFVRQHFKRDPNVDLVSFYILRTHRNATHALPSELSLIRFPAEELFRTHLPSFDLVILQDFERYPPAVALYLDNLARWVRKGGGLVLVGGEHTLSRGGFYGSALASILPVRLLPPGPPSTLLDEQPFRPHWSPVAARHPLTAPLARPGGISLGRLPPLGGLDKVAGLAPGAAVLAVHPRLQDASGAPAPVIAARAVERGRTAVLLTDTFWQWRFQGGPAGALAFDSLWRRLVGYLLWEPEFGQVVVRAAPTSSRYTGPVPQTCVIQVLETDGRAAAGVPVSWSLHRAAHALPRARIPQPRAGAGGASGGSVGVDGRLPSGSGKTDSQGQFRLTLPPLPPGAYRLEARASLPEGERQGALWLARNAVSREQTRVAPDPERLARLAAATGGQVVNRPGDLQMAPLRPEPVVRRHGLGSKPALGSPWTLLLWIGLALLSEWAIRRRVALP